MLETITRDVLSAERPLHLPGGVRFPCRMTVCRDPKSGGLTLVSPIAIDDALAAEIDAVGRVTHIVGPNLYHHLHLEAAHARYPAARLVGAPGLLAKRDDLAFDGVVEREGDAGPGLVPIALGGTPALNEVLLVHRPSRSLVVTDLVFNIRQIDGLLANLALWLMGTRGRFAQSRSFRLLTKDRRAAGESVEEVLSHGFDRVIPAHGAVFEDDAREALFQATTWMRGGAKAHAALPPVSS